MGMRVNVSNNMKRIAARVEGGAGTALQAGAALMQREIMMAAIAMQIWDTGTLINAHTRRRVGAMEWEIISPVEYSIYVHEGATYKAKGGAADAITGARSLRPRPWFTVGIANAEPKVIALLQRSVVR